MEKLVDIYKGGFFKNRHRLNWRAPIVVDVILDIFPDVESVIDMGCATGDIVKSFLNRGVEAYGLEGAETCLPFIEVPKNRMLVQDLRLPIVLSQRFDLVLCLEVAEHIEPEYAGQLVENMTIGSDKILTSMAPPKCLGHHHVNCQELKYWINKFNKVNYVFDLEITESFKKAFLPWGHKKGIKAYYEHVAYFYKKRVM